ncbi:hypothetical protein GCM10010840_30920 [Deinococcus aerolatus]|uniref:Uncharacterized protein n=1 Tax=Deinococcus aerolatus TaxID=522487 RepID=A0ABQ2GEU8_9DEIO|nr:hypothetical protein GCM10010840_30920 [Deinococcus aerolatus]
MGRFRRFRQVQFAQGAALFRFATRQQFHIGALGGGEFGQRHDPKDRGEEGAVRGGRLPAREVAGLGNSE